MLEKITNAFSDIVRSVSGKSTISEKNIEEAVEKIKIALLDADVNLRVVRRFVNSTVEEAKGEKVLRAVNPGEQFVKIIYDKITALLSAGKNELLLKGADTQSVIMLSGLQGAGKTTFAAKLANRLKKNGRRVLLAACDVVRPAAIEQLETLGRQIGVEVFSEEKNDALKNAIGALSYAKKKQFDTLICDTAGRLEIDEEMMEELVKMKKLLKADNVLLAIDSMTGQSSLEIAKTFDERLDLTGVVLTKFDSDARGGVALSLKSVIGKPILFLGTGEKLDDIDVFHPERIASRILGMGDIVSLVEKAKETIDQKEAEKLAKKIRRNDFTLEDMLEQFRQIKKMGSLQKLVEMLPGMSAALGGRELDTSGMKKSEAIILSMTKKERDNHLIIGPSRRKRIANGAGVKLQDVNKLIKQFEKSKLAMRKISRNHDAQMKMAEQLGGKGVSMEDLANKLKGL